jgi:glycosyltransferase involved in cell wall biosynthesis
VLSLPTNNNRWSKLFPRQTLPISIVVPIYNELESIPHLLAAIEDVMTQAVGLDYELLCVDDGSQDGSRNLLRDLTKNHRTLQAILLRRNYGQTPAMSAGFHHAQGQVIICLDADLQNDPKDIPRLLDKLAEGYDVVSGWRKHRQDNQLTRLIPSRIANWLISRVTGVQLNDYGCSLKAYRQEILEDMNLYGELHRFLPALAFIEGAKITEIPVDHHARQFGQSKYGLGRTLRVMMDLLTIWFMKTFLTRPMHVFGPLGLGSLGLGFLLGTYLTVLKFGLGKSIGDRPLLLLVVILLVSGVQLFCFGLLGELLMRTYHESQGRPIYRIREIASGATNNHATEP